MVEGVGEETASATRPTVFVSYASQDAAIANAVVGTLERTGLACWIAPRDVVPGSLYADEIVRAINKSSLVVLVLSAHSVASPHVGKELERASSKRRRIIALRTDAAVLPHAFEYFLSESQWIEIGAGGIEPAAVKLAEAVHHHLGSGSAIELSVAPASAGPHGQSSTRRWSGKRIGMTAIAVLALVLVAVGIQWARTRGATTHSDQTAQKGVTLAVLPFANLSSDPEQEYFSDGLTEEILNQLAQIKDLVVTGRTSSFSFKGKNEDLNGLQGDHSVSHWWEVLRLASRNDADPAAVTAQHRLFLNSARNLWIAPHQAVLNSKNNEEARTAVRRAIADAASQNGNNMQVVAWLADQLGDKDLALIALRRSVIDLHNITLMDLWSPYKTGLRTDPRFKEIVRDVGLVDYWRTSGNWGDFCKPVGTDDFECH